MKNEYIYERKGKKGLTLQIKVPYKSAGKRNFRTKSLRLSDYETKAAAYHHARMIRDQYLVDAHVGGVARRDTVKDLHEMYWNVNSYTIQTKHLYEAIYRDAVQPLEHKKIDDVTAYDIQKLLTDYAESHSDHMVSCAKSLWHRIFITAQMDGQNVSDKTLMILPVHTRYVGYKHNTTPISFDEFVTFTNALIDRTNRLKKTEKIDRDVWFMLWVMYYTGFRPAEVLALNADDIDLVNKVIHVTKSVGSTKKARRQIVTTKRPSSVRDFPISEELEVLLKSLLEYSQTKPLLLAEDGQPYDIHLITDRIIVTRRITGINFNAYQLRHAFSDSMFEQNVNPAVIRDLMGHASSTMSLEYAGSKRDQLAEAAGKRSGKK